MRQVSKNVFYDKIMHLDAVLEVSGKYPAYLTAFKLRNGTEIGKIQDTEDSDVSYYYLDLAEGEKK